MDLLYRIAKKREENVPKADTSCALCAFRVILKGGSRLASGSRGLLQKWVLLISPKHDNCMVLLSTLSVFQTDC